MSIEYRKEHLPLHDPDSGWIEAFYQTGEKHQIDLKTALLDSHKISSISLDLPFSTAILHKVLLTIAYDIVDYGEEEDEWNEDRAEDISLNSGFDREKVEEYFDKYHDRFYLMHPQFPFLQDPYINPRYNNPGLSKKDFLKETSTLNQIDPRLAYKKSPNSVIWGLPEDNIVNEEVPHEARVKTLATLLFYQVYGYTCVNKGSRDWHDSGVSKQYPAIAPLRSATHFIVEGDSLFQTLLISALWNPEYDNEDDAPIWEDSENSLGFLGKNGFYHQYFDRFVMNGRRSMMNASQLSILFLLDDEDDFDGEIRQIRRISCEYNKPEGGNSRTIPTYDPFVAWSGSVPDVLTDEISPMTVLSIGNIFNSIFSTKSSRHKEYVQPAEVIRQFLRLDVAEESIVPSLSLNRPLRVRILVMSENMTQDNKNSGIFESQFPEIELYEAINDPAVRNRISNWTESANTIHYTLRSAVARAARGDSPNGKARGFEDLVFMDYWSYIQGLFEQSVKGSSVEPISRNKDDLIEMVDKIYKRQAQPYQAISPHAYAANLAALKKKTRRILNDR